MLTQQSIRDFLAQSDYDIRESGNGRWIDQKCTPDVVCAVADFICNYVADDPSPGSCPFTSKEIWHSEYASQYVEAVFKKPAPKNKNAKHEYDKFFQQPISFCWQPLFQEKLRPLHPLCIPYRTPNLCLSEL